MEAAKSRHHKNMPSRFHDALAQKWHAILRSISCMRPACAISSHCFTLSMCHLKPMLHYQRAAAPSTPGSQAACFRLLRMQEHGARRITTASRTHKSHMACRAPASHAARPHHTLELPPVLKLHSHIQPSTSCAGPHAVPDHQQHADRAKICRHKGLAFI